MNSPNPYTPAPRALVVEDSPTQALFIRQRVVRCGFEVLLASDGRAALAEIEKSLPTIVLTDLDMPEMDGLELVKQLKIRYSGLPVILMTGKGSEEIAVQALRAGASGYIPKHKLDRDLPRILENVLAIARASRGRHQLGECVIETGSEYVLPNDAALIPPLVGRFQQNLARLQLFDATTRMQVGMALREAMVNAMEHGNLEASSTLREDDDTRYRQLIAERQRKDPFQQRRVRVRAEESRSGVTYSIADDGPGFDPASLPDPLDPENLEKASGRGLLLIRSFMDDVSHNATGNEITMVKRREG